MNANARFLILCLSGIALALLLFCLTGLIYVKKGKIAYLKKHGKIIKTLQPGFHYGFPWLYSRSRSYAPNEVQPLKVHLKGDIKILVTGNIEDSEKFESADPSYKTIISRLYFDAISEEKYRTLLLSALQTIGYQVSNVTITKKN
jgi:hypothetical protein